MLVGTDFKLAHVPNKMMSKVRSCFFPQCVSDFRELCCPCLFYRLTAPIALTHCCLCDCSPVSSSQLSHLPHHISWPFFLMLCVFYTGNVTIIQQVALPSPSPLRQCFLCIYPSPVLSYQTMSVPICLSPILSLPACPFFVPMLQKNTSLPTISLSTPNRYTFLACPFLALSSETKGNLRIWYS